ncbi:hypothetical protein Tco_1131797 [Tanacetum coccineum]|uniref:Uncharacterized protein n=1 Tax=Tanacetum coccineum TaxID=301880 RepID=A0ABQ5JA41_9ASTR
MNSPTDSYTLEHVGDFSNLSFVNIVAGLNFSEAEESINIVMGFKDRAYVYGAASVDYSRIGIGPVRDADLEARRSKKVEVNHDYEGLNMVETVKEVVEDFSQDVLCVQLDKVVFSSEDDRDLAQEMEL